MKMTEKTKECEDRPIKILIRREGGVHEKGHMPGEMLVRECNFSFLNTLGPHATL